MKEAAEAPAHEQHVLELHRTGARIGGLHPLFWIFLALIIIFFHLFLFRSVLGSHNIYEIFIAGLFIWSIVLDPQINIESGEMMQKILGNFLKC